MKYRSFKFLEYEQLNDFTFKFSYQFDNDHIFNELISFSAPIKSVRMHHFLKLYHLLAGASYYKAYPTGEFEHSYQLNQAETDFLNAHYTLGLGEFIYTNHLSFNDIAQFSANSNDVSDFDFSNSAPKLVAIGGGKDSLVTVETLEEDFDLFRVNPVDIIYKQAEISGHKLIEVERNIDRKIIELNQSGALNGHVPITNIVSMLGVISALSIGRSGFVLSNENSANIPNVEYQGRQINHQYSKSRAARDSLNNALNSRGLGGGFVISHLEDLSELEISKLFLDVALPKYSGLWNSSNNNFRLDTNSNEWSWQSPKTLSVFAMMAAYADKATLELEYSISDYDPFSENHDLWLELIGEKDIKPFECVATVQEMRQAIMMVDDRSWPAVKQFQKIVSN